MARILIIEDSEMQNELLQYMLRKNNHSTFSAHTGKEGIFLLHTTPIDLVITDMRLPDTTGIDIIKYIKSHSDLEQIKILMISADHQVQDIIEAYEVGLDAYLSKPIITKLLHIHINKLLT